MVETEKVAGGFFMAATNALHELIGQEGKSKLFRSFSNDG